MSRPVLMKGQPSQRIMMPGLNAMHRALIGPELVIAQAAVQWIPSGVNTVDDVTTDEVLITFVDGSNGADIFFDTDQGVTASNLVVGQTYVVTLQAHVDSGDNVSVRITDGTTSIDTVVVSTSFVDVNGRITIASNSTFRVLMLNMGLDESINIRNVSVRRLDR